jgi:alanine-synthesizing transaminase
MFAWGHIPEPFRAMGSMEFSKLLLEKGHVAVQPGIGFGQMGDEYVRFALIENQKRTRQALQGIKKVLQEGI